MNILDNYLEELSKIYSSEKHRLLPITEVIDRLLDIRNEMVKDSKTVDIDKGDDVA